MERAIAKEMRCICLRNGAEIWVEKERVEALVRILLESKEHRFIKIDNEIVNTADIVGVFTPQALERTWRLKQGQWQDKKGNWHSKEEKICPKCHNIIPPGKVCGYCY